MIVQEPALGPYSVGSLQWTSTFHRTVGTASDGSRNLDVKEAFVRWDRAPDFIAGEEAR